MNKIAIIKPENPFWKVFKRFGRDELISMVFNILGTVIIAAMVAKNADMKDGVKMLLIAVAGPVIEKFGFYPAHLYEGWKIYKRDGGRLRKGLWQGIRNGSVSLLEDLLIHDPVYIGLMFLGQTTYAATPAWILAFTSFVIAVIVVSLLEVGAIELWFLRFKESIRDPFSHKEKYYESRFVINADIKSEEVIQALSDKFGLESPKKYKFEDIYYKSKLFTFNGREGRIRRREFFLDHKLRKRLQITYTRAGEIPQNILTQYRFFINQKEKFSFDIQAGHDINTDPRIKNKYHDSKIYSTVKFERHSARDPKGLYAAVDKVTSSTEEDYLLVELKVFRDKDLLKQSMKFIMDEFNVVQTTHGKIDIKN